MSDPGMEAGLSRFEERARSLLADSPTLQGLLGAANYTEAIARILNVWTFDEGEEGEEQEVAPVAPIAFITPDRSMMRFSPQKNVDGPVIVSIHVCPHANHRDNKQHARRWFSNKIGKVLEELVDLQGNPITGGGTHLKIVQKDHKTDGFYFSHWPGWGDPTDPFYISGPGGLHTLTTEFEVHLEP